MTEEDITVKQPAVRACACLYEDLVTEYNIMPRAGRRLHGPERTGWSMCTDAEYGDYVNISFCPACGGSLLLRLEHA